MKKIILISLSFFFISNCSLNKVVKHHGVHFLEKKQVKLQVNVSNKNDSRKLLGPPSTTSTFDNDMWIYIERKTSSSQIRTLGRTKLMVNNVLFLEFNDRGLLVKKEFYNKDNMNEIKISEGETAVIDRKNTFMQSVLSTLKRKINDPLGKRSAN
tara:strand:+ start:27 stop:491 length:465 start_codon:yes stop_codon:yes gene_type:complete